MENTLHKQVLLVSSKLLIIAVVSLIFGSVNVTPGEIQIFY